VTQKGPMDVPGNDPYVSLKSFIEGEEKERQRLSRELHDGIGQYLIAIKMKLESLLYLDQAEIKDQISRIKDDFDKTVDEIRRISNNLMPSVLEAFGIVYALRNLCVETSEQTGIRINLEFKGDFESLNMMIKTYLFRIAQEALANIVKHSRAFSVELFLTRTKDEVFFTIHDNGKGILQEEMNRPGGHGITNMRDRVTLLNGSIDIRSNLNEGTTIAIKVPAF
jgi:signal transduction histidine kinase